MIHLIYSVDGLIKFKQSQLTGTLIDMCDVSLQANFDHNILSNIDNLFILGKNLSYESFLDMLAIETNMSWY